MRVHTRLLDTYPDGRHEWVKVGEPVRLPGILRMAFGRTLTLILSACSLRTSRFARAAPKCWHSAQLAHLLTGVPTVTTTAADTGIGDG